MERQTKRKIDRLLRQRDEERQTNRKTPLIMLIQKM